MADVSLYTNSVSPVSALALSYSKIKVNWYLPNTGYPLTLTSGNGSGTTITVSSTENLLIGSTVSVSSGTGAFVAGTTVTAINSSTQFTVSASPTTPLTGNATIIATPSAYKVLRLVRNQYAFSESQEDGEILYEFNNTLGSANLTVTQFIDGEDTSLSSLNLVSGQFAYYTVWILVVDTWINAGSASVLLPKDHGDITSNSIVLKSSHTKVMELLPRMFTSTSNSPLDAIDTSSDIYKFLKAFSLTYDEILSYADLTVKFVAGKYIPDNLVLSLFSRLGLRVTSLTPTTYKKRLISRAPDLLSKKGTLSALNDFVEIFTGFNPTLGTSNQSTNKTGLVNLLLTPQDSNFHKGTLGLWFNVVYSTLSNESSSDVPLAEQYSFKAPYRLKVVTYSSVASQAHFRLGSPEASQGAGTSVIRVKEALGVGIPVTAGTDYSFSFYCKTAANTFNLRPEIKWFDAYGNNISTNTSTGTSVSTSWTKTTYGPFTAPGKVVTATKYTVGPSTSNTVITLPTGHGFNTTTNNKVWFEDETLPFSGGFTISAFTTTSITIPYYDSGISLTQVSSSGTTFTLGTGNTGAVRIGQVVTITSGAGTGVLNGTTKVVSVLSSTQFTVDVAPTTPLNNATISINTYTITKDFLVYKATGTPIVKETPAKYAMLAIKQDISAGVTYTYYLSNIQFAPSSVTNYIEARCIDIFLDPSKVNYIIDPNFGGSGWSYAGGASAPAGFTNAESSTLTGIPYSTSNKMGKIITGSATTTATTPDLKTAAATPIVNNNTYYTFSIYIKGDAAYTLTLGLTQDSTATVKAEKVINVTTSWQRFSVTLYVTSTATGLTPYIYGSRTSAQTFRVDNAQLEESSTATDYFDGNFASQEAFWSGTSNASKSYLYVNKTQKLTELALHMNDWVPLNMSWMIRTFLGIEAVGVPSSYTVPSAAPYSSSGGGGTNVVVAA